MSSLLLSVPFVTSFYQLFLSFSRKKSCEIPIFKVFGSYFGIFFQKSVFLIKTANSYLSPQLFCFFSFSMTSFRKASESTTSTKGPKDNIRMTISGSSS